MTTRTVRAGKTASANGTLASGDQLDIQGGGLGLGAGGAAFVTTRLDDSGLISVRGGAASTAANQPGGQGALLDVVGVLTDSGSIVVQSGQAEYYAGEAGMGAKLVVTGTLSVTQTGSLTLRGGTRDVSQNEGVLTNTGLLDNAGQLDLAGGEGGNIYGPNGYGSVLDSSGTLINSGTITLHGGTYAFRADSGKGANLIDSGVMTNSGMIVVHGGISGGYLARGASGGTLAVSGLLTNTGSVVLGGGGGGYGNYGSGYGGTLLDSGTIANSGTIDVKGGGAPNDATNGAAAQLIDSGVLTNFAGATLRIDGSQASDYSGSTGGTVSVTGYLGGYGSISIAGGAGSGARFDPFGGAGGVLVDSGRLVLGGALLIGGGTASTQAHYYGGTGGTLTVAGDGQLTAYGASVITVQGGAASMVKGASTSGLGGVFDIAGDMTAYAAIVLQGGGAPQPGFTGGGGASLIVSGHLYVGSDLAVGATQGGQSATVTVTATGVLDASSATALIANNGRIVLAAGSYIYGSSSTGVLNNTGTVSGSGSISSLGIVNDGIIDAGSGQLTLESDTVTSGATPGTFRVGTGGTLTLSRGSYDSGQSVVMNAAGATLDVTAGNAGVLVRSAMGGTLVVAGGGVATLNVADTNLTATLSSATNLTLSRMSAIAAVGSVGADTITALAAGQTLTGGLGADLLTGAAATGDVFRDVAAGLNGDTIAGFAGTDMIDITDFAPGAGLTLFYAQQGATGQLTVSEGSASTTITLQGQFTAASFLTASDNHGGVQITLHG